MSHSRANGDNKTQLTDLPLDVVRIIEESVPTNNPHEIMGRLSRCNKSFSRLFKPELTKYAVNKALGLAADASEEVMPKLIHMLKQNPGLLLERGNIVTRGGIEVENVTVYEFLLGEGDPELAEQVGLIFANLANGEAERIKQYDKYKPFIDGMLEKTPYDLIKLVETIKQASAVDVQAALEKEVTGSILEKALTGFRQAVTVKKITQPQMHYHYATLIQAFDLWNTEWKHTPSIGDNYNKRNLLFWRQVIGYLQRGIPAVDRFAFAKNIYDLIVNDQTLIRNTNYKFRREDAFPNCSLSNSSLSGLGFDYLISSGPQTANHAGVWRGVRAYQNFCLIKFQNLQNLCTLSKNANQPRA